MASIRTISVLIKDTKTELTRAANALGKKPIVREDVGRYLESAKRSIDIAVALVNQKNIIPEVKKVPDETPSKRVSEPKVEAKAEVRESPLKETALDKLSQLPVTPEKDEPEGQADDGFSF